MKYKKISFLILTGAILLMLSCKEDDLLPPANTNAYISFINTSPFLGNDGLGNRTAVRAAVEMNGKADTNDLFLTYTFIYPQPNKYVPFTAGNGKVSFKDSTRSPLVTGGITTHAGAYYSAILADSVDHYSAVIVQDDYQPVTGKALIRVMHFSPDAGEVILYRDTIKLSNLSNMRYKQVTPYTPVEPGNNFSFIIRKNDGTNQRVARFFTESLLPGAAYTLLLKGYITPPDGDIANKASSIILYRN